MLAVTLAPPVAITPAGLAQPDFDLVPIAADTFYAVPPQVATSLRFKVRATRARSEVGYLISDYEGKAIRSGRARIAFGKLEISVKLPVGYYEVRFTAAPTFGFTVAPLFEGPRDRFFGLDTALSWIVPDKESREALVRVVAKSGFGMARERLGWMQVEPSPGDYRWDANHQYDSLRQVYRQNGVAILEGLYGGPANWDFRRAPTQAEAVQLQRSITELARRWGDVWAGVEVWNEIDLHDVPPEVYVRALRTVHDGIRSANRSTPVVAGAFAKFNETYLDRLADAGMLDFADALSIHPYGTSEETREMLQSFRRWLAKRGRPELPVWTSESGRAWPRGTDRPPVVDDVRSAKANTIRGVLARAENAPTYFPFVFPFFEEKELNYGLTDRRLTPLRSFAAYATLARMLSHAQFDRKNVVAGARESYEFHASDRTIQVVFTDEPAVLKAPTELTGRAYGMDGRDLGDVRDSIRIPDGLTYIVAARETPR